MGFFHPNYNAPGPGVRKDEPRKKGLARFAEILGRDSGDLFRANLLCVISILPAAFLVVFGLLGQALIITILGGLIGGMLFGPFYAGLHDTILRAMRDEPGYWWHTYKKAFRLNWRQSLVPGAILGFLVACQLSMGYFLLFSQQIRLSSAFLLCINVLLTSMVFPYYFNQMVLMNMNFPTLVKNSLLLAFSHAPRSIAAAVVQVVYWLAFLLFFPFSSLWVFLFGFAFIQLIVAMIVYPPLDKCFHLEERFLAKRKEQEEQDRQP